MSDVANTTAKLQAPTRMYRCHVCVKPNGQPGVEFESDTKVCPGCGTDGRDPRNAGIIHNLVCLHFDAPTRIPFRGVGYLACQPGVPVGQGGTVFTGLPQAVTCPACKETDAFKTAYAVASFDPKHDIPIVVTRGGPKLAAATADE